MTGPTPDAAELTLYYRPGTCALAAYMALEEAGAAFTAVDVSKSLDLLNTLNPRGKVPVLGIGNRVLVENSAILVYIARRFPAAGLLPSDPVEEAQCLAIAAWFASTLHIDFRRFLKPFVYSPDKAAHDGIREEGRVQYLADLDEVDRMVEGRDWLHGDRLTIVDFYGLVFVQWAVTTNIYNPGWHNIERWKQNLLRRPAVQKVMRATGSPLAAQIPG